MDVVEVLEQVLNVCIVCVWDMCQPFSVFDLHQRVVVVVSGVSACSTRMQV